MNEEGNQIGKINNHDTLQELKIEYVKNKIDFYKMAISANYQIVTFMGVVAGFGFIAFNSIRTKELFFAAEIIIGYIAGKLLFHTSDRILFEYANISPPAPEFSGERKEVVSWWDNKTPLEKKEFVKKMLLPTWMIVWFLIGCGLLILSFCNFSFLFHYPERNFYFYPQSIKFYDHLR